MAEEGPSLGVQRLAAVGVPPKLFRVVVLKWDRLYADLVRQQILNSWPSAEVRAFSVGMEALEAIQERMPDIFISGARVEDMDGLEHLEPFIERELPILVITSRPEHRFFSLLRTIRYDGLYDAATEGLGNLSAAVRSVMAHQQYISVSFASKIRQPKSITVDGLTPKEEFVLSVIGDGCDDHEAGRRLGLSSFTVNTHRKSIMAKMNLHHKGQLMLYALRHGYVQITPTSVFRPGFQRKMQRKEVKAEVV